MAVDAILRLSRPDRRDAYLDWLQMLTGVLLILFMWCHMILVSSVIISPRLMNSIAWFFEATYMVQLGGPAIFLVFLMHFILASRRIPFTATDQQTIWSHAKFLKHRDTWLWLVQTSTAIIILIMGSIHMWVVLNDLPITAAKSAARVASHGWTLFYLILLPAAELHVSIGFYRVGVKWGFVSAVTRPKAKRMEYILFCVFTLIGLLTIILFLTLA